RRVARSAAAGRARRGTACRRSSRSRTSLIGSILSAWKPGWAVAGLRLFGGRLGLGSGTAPAASAATTPGFGLYAILGAIVRRGGLTAGGDGHDLLLGLGVDGCGGFAEPGFAAGLCVLAVGGCPQASQALAGPFGGPSGAG